MTPLSNIDNEFTQSIEIVVYQIDQNSNSVEYFI